MIDLHILPGRADGSELQPRPKPVAHDARLESDEVYFTRRSSEERTTAENAADARLRSLHLDLSGRYEQMAAAIKEADDKRGR